MNSTEEPQAPSEPPHLRLMTTEQYLNTLGYIFGPSVTMEMKFAPLQRDNGLLANDALVKPDENKQLTASR